MNKFRVVPVIFGGQKKWEVQRQVGWLLKEWIFETFAASEHSAKVAIEHLGGPIIQITTLGKSE